MHYVIYHTLCNLVRQSVIVIVIVIYYNYNKISITHFVLKHTKCVTYVTSFCIKTYEMSYVYIT